MIGNWRILLSFLSCFYEIAAPPNLVDQIRWKQGKGRFSMISFHSMIAGGIEHHGFL